MYLLRVRVYKYYGKIPIFLLSHSYLQIEQITLVEADAILVSVYHINENIADDCVLPSHIDSTSLMVMSLYTQLHTWIVRCFSLVGMTKCIVEFASISILVIN